MPNPNPYGFKIRCMAIPDGMSADGKSLRVSAILAPITDPDGPFDIKCWPLPLASGYSFHIHFLDEACKTVATFVRPCGELSNWKGDEKIQAAAACLWTDIFKTFPTLVNPDNTVTNVDGFKALLDICTPGRNMRRDRKGCRRPA